MREFVRLAVALVAHLPDIMGLGLNRWLMDAHQPAGLDADADWCRTCHDPWPCDGFTEAAGRAAAYGRTIDAATARNGSTPGGPDGT